MGDLTLTCVGCGTRFVWTEKEQAEAEDLSGDGGLVEIEPYCKACRPKQDQQRS